MTSGLGAQQEAANDCCNLQAARFGFMHAFLLKRGPRSILVKAAVLPMEARVVKDASNHETSPLNLTVLINCGDRLCIQLLARAAPLVSHLW